jgi:hypothetical protein
VSESSTLSTFAFFNERGTLFWLTEDGLRDVVIVDAIAYFDVPSTILICDPTQLRRRRYCNGEVVARLVGYAEEYDRLLQLMLKLG